MNMSRSRAQLFLMLTYIGFFLLNLIGILWLYLNMKIYQEDATVMVVTFLEIYSIPLSVILAGIFAGKSKSKKAYDSKTVLVTFLVSFLWNILLLWSSLAYTLSETGDIESYIADLKQIASKSSFLVAAALVYLFSKR